MNVTIAFLIANHQFFKHSFIEIKTKRVGIRTDANSRTHVGWQGTSWECQTATTADNPVLEQRM
jgi:hypothetical protein